jgi:transcriptional regulator with XRE-family HTH domain
VVATDLGITPRAYSKLERGDTQLTVVRLFEISKILGMSPQDVLGFEANHVFKNNPHQQQGGSYVADNNTEIEFIRNIHERFLAEKDAQIALLKGKTK